MEITLKSFKYYPALSEDSNSFSATLYINGVMTAYATDDGHGGCVDIQPAGRTDIQRQENRRALQVAEAWVRDNIPGESYTVTMELPPASIVDPIKANEMYDSLGIKAGSTSNGVMPTTLEDHVADLAQAMVHDILVKKEEVQFRRECKTKTLFGLPGDRDGEYHTYDRPFGPKMVATMKEKHPDADIWNYKYGGALSAADEQKQLDVIKDRDYKKKCKRVTLFRLDDGKVYQSKDHYGYFTRLQLQLQYGDRLVEIINDRLDPLPSTDGLVAVYRLHYIEYIIPAQWRVVGMSYVLPKEVADYKDHDAIRFTTDLEEVKRVWAESHRK